MHDSDLIGKHCIRLKKIISVINILVNLIFKYNLHSVSKIYKSSKFNIVLIMIINYI